MYSRKISAEAKLLCNVTIEMIGRYQDFRKSKIYMTSFWLDTYRPTHATYKFQHGF